MVAHAARFHFFIVSKRLNIKLLFLVRHPLTNIRALQSWFVTPGHKSKTNNGSTTELARKWQRVARVYLDQQPTAAIFAAHMRFEDLLCSPEHTLQRVLSDLSSHQQMHTSADSLPALNSKSWKALSSVLEVRHQPMGKYEHSMYVNATYGAVELAAVLDICEPEMAAFNYYAGDVYPTHAQLLASATGDARNVHRASSKSAHTCSELNQTENKLATRYSYTRAACTHCKTI
tara:strand:+ start:192 stop:887 length:696 start_codon:yes stop_codon:yes gene_type:complete